MISRQRISVACKHALKIHLSLHCITYDGFKFGFQNARLWHDFVEKPLVGFSCWFNLYFKFVLQSLGDSNS
jgi:hypothetical protein